MTDDRRKCPLCGADVVYEGALLLECSAFKTACQNGTKDPPLKLDEWDFETLSLPAGSWMWP